MRWSKDIYIWGNHNRIVLSNKYTGFNTFRLIGFQWYRSLHLNKPKSNVVIIKLIVQGQY